jgi:hypothetical protein
MAQKRHLFVGGVGSRPRGSPEAAWRERGAWCAPHCMMPHCSPRMVKWLPFHPQLLRICSQNGYLILIESRWVSKPLAFAGKL